MKNVLEHSRKADIAFSRNGRIDIGARIARLLRLRKGDVVALATDGEEIYLYVRYRQPAIGRYEGTVYPSNRRGFHFRTSSKAVCEAVMERCGAGFKARLFTGEPVSDPACGTMLPIITRTLLQS